MLSCTLRRVCALVTLASISLAALSSLTNSNAFAQPADSAMIRAVADAQPASADEWLITDDGAFVTAENSTLKLRFAYNAANQQGWFQGDASSKGGGGRDGAINAQTNTIAHGDGSRVDSYSGFMIQGNGSSPNIMVTQVAKSDWDGPFSQIARQVAQDPRSASTDYRSYVETALFSFNWAPNNLTQVGTTWFYMTTPGLDPSGNIWDQRGYWSTSLGTWTETFKVIIDPSLQPSDYLARWTQITGNPS